MKILLVDDELEKSRDIFAALQETGAQIDEMVHRSNAREARSLLREHQFDLVIVDLNLPEMLDSPPKSDGGLDFFDLLIIDKKVKLPKAVVFITGKEELYDQSEIEALKRGAQLCHYSNRNQLWKPVLQAKIKYLAALQERVPMEYPKVDIAVITALRSELDAVLALPYEWKTVRYPGNSIGYNHGTIKKKDGTNISIVAAAAFSKGMPSSAALAAQVCILFRPKFIVMLGICAGVQRKTNLGNVIVADPTWDWGSGKIAESGDGERIFLAAPQQRPLNTQISQLCLDLSADAALVRTIRSGWSGKLPEGEFKVQVGPMASGASVLANDATIQEITSQNRDLIAVEMEAYAVMAAAEYSLLPAPIAIAIKSVCDFADSKKSDDWQRYAAYTSAAFFDRLVMAEDFPL